MRVRYLAERVGAVAKRQLFPTPAEAAGRLIETRAAGEPRYVAGRISVLGLDLEYVDARTLELQWREIFVRRSLAISLESASPRILDCGANVGLASLWLKQQYPAARITAFEPDAVIADTLRRNLARNGAADVEVMQAAVWREDGSATFRREGADSGALDPVAADTSGDRVPVPTVRLRRWLTSEPIDLLKIDIEGAELDVLVDSADCLDRVHNLCVEVHDFQAQRRLLPHCLLVLERAGFTYALGDFTSAAWRSDGQPRGPFPSAVPSWIVMVRAWREGGLSA